VRSRRAERRSTDSTEGSLASWCELVISISDLCDCGNGFAGGEVQRGWRVSAGPGVERLQLERDVLAGVATPLHYAGLAARHPEYGAPKDQSLVGVDEPRPVDGAVVPVSPIETDTEAVSRPSM